MTLQVECPSTWVEGAGVLVLGEAPGEEEVKRGMGFVGRAGTLLEKLLLAAGLPREHVSFSNVAKRRPPGNDFTKEFYRVEKHGGKKVLVATEELVEWRGQLVRDLEEHPHKVVVACGNEALKAVTGLEGIAKRRGSAWPDPCDGVEWVVAMLHPSALLRGAQWQEVTMGAEVLKRAAYLARPAIYSPPPYTVDILTGDEAAPLFRKYCMEGLWSLDLETLPGDGTKCGTISLLGGAWYDEGETRAVVVPWPSGEVWKAVRECIDRNGENMVGHNLVYDQAWLQDVGAWPERDVYPFDTMQRWHFLNPELPKALDFVAAWSIGEKMPYWKDEGRKLHKKKRTPEEETAYYYYNAKDCVASLWIAEWIEHEEVVRKRKKQAWERSNWEVACEMQEHGFQLDRGEVLAVSREVEDVRTDAAAALQVLAPDLNPGSPQQVMYHLYVELGLPVQWKGKRKTADEEALKQLKRTHPHAFVDELMRWRKAEQLRKMFMAPLEAAARRDDQVLRCGWIPDATETFRFAGTTYPLGGGLNAQTVPKPLRTLLHAPLGRVFIQPDLSQAEARYVAYRSKDEEMIQLFNDPSRSVHLERAREIFGREVSKEEPEYRKAKSTVHAANYMEGPKRLSLQLNIPLGQAKQLLKRAQRKDILRWHGEVRETARRVGMLENCWGQERLCHAAVGMLTAVGQIGDTEVKELVAWEPQSAIPQVINQAIFRLRHIDLQDEVWFHGHGHDSFLASIPVERVEFWLERVGIALRAPMQVGGKTLTIPIDMEIGFTWGQMVEYGEGWEEEWHQKYDNSFRPELAIERALEALEVGGEDGR